MARKQAELNEVGDVVIRDVDTMLALADPNRYQMFEVLRKEGPWPVAMMAQRWNRGEKEIEADVEQLASVGLVEETATGEWMGVGSGLFLDAPDEPEHLAAAKQLASVMMAGLYDMPRRWANEVQPDLPGEWWRASGALNVGVVLTADELNEIQSKMEILIEPYVNRSADQRPEDGRRVRLLSFFMPEAA